LAPDGELDLTEVLKPRIAERRPETHSEDSARTSEKGWLAIGLAWTAGVVDAVGYILLSKVFTAHLSGDSAAFPVYAGIHDWIKVLARGLPIPLFLLGAFAGGVLMETAAMLGVRRRLTLALGCEVLMLGAFLIGVAVMGASALRQTWQISYFVLLSMLAAAMGLQTVALQRVGGRTVRTTFVTGMLTGCVNALVRWTLRHQRHPDSPAAARREGRRSLRQARFLALLWCAFASGALVGSFAEPSWKQWALLPGLAVAACIAAIDIVRPVDAAPARRR
jgi:uncharacterized membrane protein YoaK (UPF0700 family)